MPGAALVGWMTVRAHTSGNDLEALIAAEARLEQLVADARADAADRVTRARTRAASEEHALRDDIAAAVAQVTREVEGATAARIAQLRADADADAARYRALAERGLDALVDAVLDRFVALVARRPP